MKSATVRRAKIGGVEFFNFDGVQPIESDKDCHSPGSGNWLIGNKTQKTGEAK